MGAKPFVGPVPFIRAGNWRLTPLLEDKSVIASPLGPEYT